MLSRGNRYPYPLRRVLGRSPGDPARGEYSSLWYEELECGHRVTPRQDFIGETYAVRRPCGQCYWAAQKEFTRRLCRNSWRLIY